MRRLSDDKVVGYYALSTSALALLIHAEDTDARAFSSDSPPSSRAPLPTSK